MKKQVFLWQRVAEIIVIELISSCLIYALIVFGVITNGAYVYLIVFGLSAFLFLGCNLFVLRNHYRMLRYNTRAYLWVNLTLYFLQGISSAVGLKYFPNELYTAFFGYTKFFRIFGISPLYSSLIIWAMYFVLILLVIPLRKITHKLKKKKAKQKKELESRRIIF